jgi:hypothetical protein
MAKQRGHRANKSNDSFGTINDENLYRGKYRDEVYKDDDEEATPEDPSQEVEATQQEEDASFVAPKQKDGESETDYKKRYDDLKRHYDSKLEEWKLEREEIVKAQQVGQEQGIAPSNLPRTPEQLEEFKEKYPDVYAVVETISTQQADYRLQSLKEEVEQLRAREEQLQIRSAYKELTNKHPDFTELKTDEKFLTWLDQQPSTISDGIYKNNRDAAWASRVVDLYKADMGISTKKRKASRDDAAATVKVPKSRDVVSEADTDKRIWKASEIGRLKPWEFEKIEKEIDSARAEGRIDYSQ